MYGVPKSLQLDKFHGATLIQICLGQHQLQFHFADPTLHIYVEGSWVVTDAAGALADRSTEHGDRESYRIHALLGQMVVAHELNPPESFGLIFANGWKLTVIDDSKQYESFSIQPGNVYV